MRPPPVEKERAAFEKWFASTINGGHPPARKEYDPSEYKYLGTADMWQAWQASRTQLSEGEQSVEDVLRRFGDECMFVDSGGTYRVNMTNLRSLISQHSARLREENRRLREEITRLNKVVEQAIKKAGIELLDRWIANTSTLDDPSDYPELAQHLAQGEKE